VTHHAAALEIQLVAARDQAVRRFRFGSRDRGKEGSQVSDRIIARLEEFERVRLCILDVGAKINAIAGIRIEAWLGGAQVGIKGDGRGTLNGRGSELAAAAPIIAVTRGTAVLIVKSPAAFDLHVQLGRRGVIVVIVIRARPDRVAIRLVAIASGTAGSRATGSHEHQDDYRSTAHDANAFHRESSDLSVITQAGC